MTSAKLIDKKSKSYNRKFTVEIDLTDVDDNYIESYLEKINELNFEYQLKQIIKNEND